MSTKNRTRDRSKTDDKNSDLFTDFEVIVCSGLIVKYCTIFCPFEWLQ